jgi:hypothetical protein
MKYGRDVSTERWYADSQLDARRTEAVEEWARKGYVVGALVQWQTTDNQWLMNGYEPSAAAETFDELCAVHGIERVVPIAPTRAIATELGYHPEAPIDDLTLYMVPGTAAY